MRNSLTDIIENSRQAIRYWWLILLVGILFAVTRCVVFAYPAESYLALTLLFGIVIFVSGIFQTVLAATNRHYITGWGWLLASGIIEIVLGVILMFNPGISAVTLSIFFAFWLIFRGFTMIGLGADMNRMKVGGAVWTIVTGILLMIIAVFMLVQPLTYGTSMVIIWTGVSLIFAGIAAAVFAFQLKNMHKYVE